jgi:hypothetical protein
MQKSACHFAAALALATIIFLLPIALPAQSIWLDRRHSKIIALEIIKPNLSEGFFSNTTFPTSVMYLSVRWPINEKLNVVGELPFAHGGIEFNSDFFDFNESESTIGNPYLGLEIRGQGSEFFTEIGARAPLASESNLGTTIGFLSDFVDHGEAFFPDVVSIVAVENYQHRAASGLTARLRGGPSFWIYTGSGDLDDDVELFLLYSAQAGYESDIFSLIGGVSGRLLATESGLDIGERTAHQLGASASVDLGRVRPGVQFRLPLDNDFQELLDFAFGLNLGIEL